MNILLLAGWLALAAQAGASSLVPSVPDLKITNRMQSYWDVVSSWAARAMPW